MSKKAFHIIRTLSLLLAWTMMPSAASAQGRTLLQDAQNQEADYAESAKVSGLTWLINTNSPSSSTNSASTNSPTASSGGDSTNTNSDGTSATTSTPSAATGFGTPDSSTLGTQATTETGTASVDFDGDPNGQAIDPDWQSTTSGSVNGQAVNSSQYNYVVIAGNQNGTVANVGDWAQVTNTATGESTWARVEDVGPSNDVGEISSATASSVGIATQGNATVGNPSVSITYYKGSAGSAGQ